jgi:hypothetical protein
VPFSDRHSIISTSSHLPGCSLEVVARPSSMLLSTVSSELLPVDAVVMFCSLESVLEVSLFISQRIIAVRIQHRLLIYVTQGYSWYFYQICYLNIFYCHIKTHILGKSQSAFCLYSHVMCCTGKKETFKLYTLRN